MKMSKIILEGKPEICKSCNDWRLFVNQKCVNCGNKLRDENGN